MISVRIPTTLRSLTAGESEVQVDGSTIAEVMDGLEAAHPGFKERILTEEGELQRFVNVFVDDSDARYMDGMGTALTDGQTVSIVPAVAGGTI